MKPINVFAIVFILIAGFFYRESQALKNSGKRVISRLENMELCINPEMFKDNEPVYSDADNVKIRNIKEIKEVIKQEFNIF
jgi:hypothetical protein